MQEKPGQYGSAAEIEQDVFLLAEHNFREAYAVDPIGALEQWFELVAERKIRGVTSQEIDEMSWSASERADKFDFDKELTNAG